MAQANELINYYEAESCGGVGAMNATESYPAEPPPVPAPRVRSTSTQNERRELSDDEFAIVRHPMGAALLMTPEELQALFIRWVEKSQRYASATELAFHRRYGDGALLGHGHLQKGSSISRGHVPDDVALTIALFVDARTLGAMQCACRHWRSLFSRDEFWAAQLLHEFGLKADDLNPRPGDLRAFYGVLATTRADMFRGAEVRRQAQRVMQAHVSPGQFAGILAATGTAQMAAPLPAAAVGASPSASGSGGGGFWGWAGGIASHLWPPSSTWGFAR